MKIVESLYNSYQSEKNTLPPAQKSARENEIITKERAAKELQRTYFGQDGALAKRSVELLSPIKEKVQATIEKIAGEME